MAKKTHLKVRMVQKAILIVNLFIMQKNRQKGKAKEKLKLKKAIPIIVNTNIL